MNTTVNTLVHPIINFNKPAAIQDNESIESQKKPSILKRGSVNY